MATNPQSSEYEYYKRIKLLGEGSFGKAYLVECVSDGSLCVIKQVDLSKMNDQEKKETLKEAKILEVFNHPNIVKFREVYKTKKGKLCIVMDYADGGDLAKRISAQKGSYFPETQVIDWFTQICLALKHVHDRKVLHRDLKCQNIFLTKTNIIKLGDFGIARVLSSTRENCKTMVGTPYYLSPEIINGKAYSFKSDIWSLGVVLYELCALKPPFDASTLPFLAMKIVKGQYSPIPAVYSKEMKNLIATLLQLDPMRRPNANQILKMPIIQDRIKHFLSESIRVTEFSHTVIHNKNFVQGQLKLQDLKNVNNESPMPQNMLPPKNSENPKPPLPNNNNNPNDKNNKPPIPNPQQKVVQAPIVNQNQQIQRPPSNPSNNNQVNKPQEKPIEKPIYQPPTQQNNNQKPNYHYNPGNNKNPVQNNNIAQQPQPYNGPKIVDASKPANYEPPKTSQPGSRNVEPKPDLGLQRVNSDHNAIKMQQEKNLVVRDQAREQRQQALDKYNLHEDKNKDKEDPNGALNRNKWVAKPIENPVVQPKPEPRDNNLFKKAAERDIIGGGGGGGMAFGFNLGDQKKKPQSVDDKKKKSDEAALKEKLALAEEKKKKIIQQEKEAREKEREQRELEREAQRKQMQDDIRKKREHAQGAGFKFEVLGADEQPQEVISKPNNEIKSKPQPEPKKEVKRRPPWVDVVEQPKNIEVEILVPTKKPEEKRPQTVAPPEEKKLDERPLPVKKESATVQSQPQIQQPPVRRNKWVDELNEVQQSVQLMNQKLESNVVLNKKEKEEMQAFDEMVAELNKIIEDPDKEDDIPLSVNNRKGEEDADRDDDENEDEGQENFHQQMNQFEMTQNESLEYMTDYSKLEVGSNKMSNDLDLKDWFRKCFWAQ